MAWSCSSVNRVLSSGFTQHTRTVAESGLSCVRDQVSCVNPSHLAGFLRKELRIRKIYAQRSCVKLGVSGHKETVVTTNEKLIDLLSAAGEHLGNYTGGHSYDYTSAEEFRIDFKVELHKYRDGNIKSIEKFYGWFLPTSTWDDLTGSDKESERIANQLLPIIEKEKQKGR